MVISENQEKLPTLYWLPKLHKRPYESRFIANSSSCTTTELSKLLTSCLTAVKKHLIKYYDTCYERDGINRFWSIKNSNEVLNQLKSKVFKASTLSTYDFSILYTTLQHHLIKDKLIDLIELKFSQEKALYYAPPPESGGVLCYTLRNFECPSVRPSVSAHHHSCIGNSSYSFRPILLKLYRCFKDGLKICILFFQNPEIIFYHFFRIFNLDIFRALILQICIWSMYLVSATPPTFFGESF